MIAYLDTSAFVPLVIHEAKSPDCRQFWNDVTLVLATRLLYVEAVAAMRRANRAGRLENTEVPSAVRRLEDRWQEIRVIELDSTLAEMAGNVAWRFGLKGYDAVHCAAANLLRDEFGQGEDGGSVPFVAASGDRQLLAAWDELGVATFEPSV